ncbi:MULTISPECIES: alpha-ketoglutarate-dependent dioxygenase AlkB family protein [unclassified Variovorax]|uniref:alpha-ketoglutarate-dependent dioxygenase AlkB family protein n=1 Tax=unclassified Variovorax TaxID=663243 RepID=UPI00131801C3|nr:MULTISPECIES: alpha-ketoglutarate-dependent dioxygenase AlkB [unclassified Variovorax]VTU42546.1 hypothetical protein H6P1_00218 [Variovorax sp. PBL-H6]VTU43853.1 hypothetical protein SRS16P1_00684 [Variovorax sp. SRS16]VTU43917.1 hypothetical protein E5P1_00677 [Variovorax sp. PBL-E5]
MDNSFFSDFIGPFPDVLWEPAFLTPAHHAELLEFCLDGIQWQTKMASWGGRLVEFPRQLAWFGDVPYAYSGILHQPVAMPAPLKAVRQRIEAYLCDHGVPTDLNSVLLNRYRSGNDSIGMHSDDETQLGPQPVIASISLGDSRTFVFEHRRPACGTRTRSQGARSW